MAEHPNPVCSFIWADKAALALALLTGLIWAAAWWSAFIIVGDLGANYLWLHLGLLWTKVGILILISAWLMMRTIDCAAGGQTFRIARRYALSLEDGLMGCGRLVARHVHPQRAHIVR